MKKAKPQVPTATKLDLGSGSNGKPDFLHVDILPLPGVDLVLDLRTLWPWGDGTIEEVHSGHFLEHLDGFERIHFFNELYRVMKLGAKANIVVPHWSSCRAYGDPTHKWPPVCEFALFYLNKTWRLANAPHTDCANLKGGYNCDFEATWGYSLEPGVALRSQEYQTYAATYYKEACQDMIFTLTRK